MERPIVKNSPDPIDIHVGRRVRDLRVTSGVSQMLLAVQIGLTFHQVQKYERGENRISASMLFRISCILKVPVSYFFEGLSDEVAGFDTGMPDARSEIHQSHLQLVRDFNRIPAGPVREYTRKLIRACADTIGEPPLPQKRSRKKRAPTAALTSPGRTKNVVHPRD